MKRVYNMILYYKICNERISQKQFYAVRILILNKVLGYLAFFMLARNLLAIKKF